MVEYRAFNAGVLGSIPSTSTRLFCSVMAAHKFLKLVIQVRNESVLSSREEVCMHLGMSNLATLTKTRKIFLRIIIAQVV